MIRAVLYRNGEGQFTGFSAKGHAGYAEEGSDIVCAGVSTLTITCVNSLEAVCGVSPKVSGGEDGLLSAFLPHSLTQAQAHDAQVLLSSLHVGLASLAETYPQYVHLSIQERRETQ